jgi:hypothetical protein
MPGCRSISSAEYAGLIARHCGGVAPVVAPPPTPKITKHARAWSCAHCPYVATTKGLLRRHEADRHDIDVVWCPCAEQLADGTPCLYRGKNKDDLREHLRKAHSIGVVWHACDQPGCDFRTKTANALTKHKANRHDIDVVWHYCQVPGCIFVTKQRGGLLQHGRWMHSGREVRHKSRAAKNAQPPAPAPPPPPFALVEERERLDYSSESEGASSDEENDDVYRSAVRWARQLAPGGGVCQPCGAAA